MGYVMHSTFIWQSLYHVQTLIHSIKYQQYNREA